MSDPYTVEVPVRYRDLDPLGHVNHAVYASYLEAARIDYLEDLFDDPAEELSFVIANLEIDYRHPVEAGDDPDVALWVTDLGDSSCTMAYEVRTADGDVAAEAETTLVHVDPEAKRPAPFPEDVRERIREREGLEAPPRE